MPGKNTQDWTDDAAFWDEAWADMEQRLEEKPSRKGLFLWARWALLLTLLLGGLVAARVISNLDGPAPDAPVRSEAIVADQKTTTVVPEEELSPLAAEAASGAAVATPAAAPTPPQKAPSLSDIQQQTEEESHAVAYHTPEVPVSGKSQGTPEAIQTAPTSVAEIALDLTPAEISPQHTVPAVNTTPPSEPRLIPQVIRPLPWSVEQLQLEDQPLAETTIKHSKKSLPLLIGAGATIAQGRQTPGYYAGIGVELSPKGRLSFPLGLRYRKDFLRLGENTGSRVENDFAAGIPNADQNTTPVEALTLASGSQATELTTSGIELTSGIHYRVSPKLSLGVNVGGEYLLTASGVIDATREGEMLSYTFNNRETANFDVNGSFTNISAFERSFSGVSSDSGINRFRLRTGLEVKYQVLPRFGVTAGATRAMTSTYRNDLLRIRPTQFHLGVQYRLR